MWDEDEPIPYGLRGYWKVMGGQGLSPRLSEYDLDKLLDHADGWLDIAEHLNVTAGIHPTLWVNFTSNQMFSAARRWQSSITR